MKKIRKTFVLSLSLLSLECTAQTISGQVGSYDYVDLGLPSGTLWATCNVGASAPDAYGDYFAWGETKTKDDYSWSTYKWCTVDSTGNYDKITKYNASSDYGRIDNNYTLEAEDDAAVANWGDGWHTPTLKDLEELISGCTWKWDKNHNGTGIIGQVGTSKTNKNVIFIPAGGYYDGDSVSSDGSALILMSSSLKQPEANISYNICAFSSFNGIESSFEERYVGLNVRAIISPKLYTVNFYTIDSTLIKSEQVVEGRKATNVNAPEISGFVFIGWSDSSFVNVTKDLDIYAKYKEISFETGKLGKYSYVDLGLNSGAKWATFNVGATKIDEFGNFYAWGETKPKSLYVEDTYKWSTSDDTGWLDQLLKYNFVSQYGNVDNKKVLDASDDAATANWGADWRMPTTNEFKELINGCTWTWTTNFKGSGISGKIGKSKTNGNAIFFPAAGTSYEFGPTYVGDNAYYWTSEITEESKYANHFYAFENAINCFYKNRYYGNNVRAVAAAEITNASNIKLSGLQVYAKNGVVQVLDATANSRVQVFDIHGKMVASAVTDCNGKAEIMLSVTNGVYIVTTDNQSTKIIIRQ